MIDNRKAPVISVQRHYATNLVEGQLGTGVLIAPDVVLVPSETIGALVVADGPADVVLGPADFAHNGGSPLDAVVESRAVTAIEIVGLGEIKESYTDGDVARLRLATPSEYLPAWGLEQPSRRARQTKRFLATISKRKGGRDVWTGMEAAGVLPPGHREPPSDTWLQDAELVLRAQHTPRIPDRILLALEKSGSFWCCICPWCCKC